MHARSGFFASSVSIALAIAALTTLPKDTARADDSPATEQARANNAQVLQLQAQRTRGGGANRSAEDTAFAARASHLAALIEDDPTSAVAIAFPAEVLTDLATDFPEQGNTLEQRGTWQGELEVLIEDSASMSTHRIVFKLHRDGETLDVYFAGHAPGSLRSGAQVAVAGVRAGARVAATEIEWLDAPIDATPETPSDAESNPEPNGATYPATCGPKGSQSVLAVLVNLPSYTLPANVTPDFVRSALLGNAYGTSNTPDWSVDDFWRQNSDDRNSIDPANTTVIGPINLTKNYNTDVNGGSMCDNYGLRDAVIKAIDSQVDFKRYSLIQITMPSNGACGWSGTANVGCRSLSSTGDGAFNAAVSWQKGESMGTRARTVQLMAHELGHNLGLYHAASRDFGAEALGPLGNPGTLSEYGDPHSIMGAWNFGFYDASQATRQLGWWTSANVRTVETAGTYAIQNYEGRPAGIKALKIRRGTGNNAWLWIESRQNTGNYSSQLNPSLFSGALIHYEDNSTGGYGHVLDFTPATSTFNDAALASGQTWTDPYSDVRVTIGAITPTAMTVTVNYGAPVCTRAAPTVTASPTVLSTTAGGSAATTITVRNNSSAGCAAETFNLGSTAPSGWTKTLGSASLAIAPGLQSTTSYSVGVGAAQSPGTFAVSATATSATSALAATATANVTVTAPACTRAAPTVTLSPTSLTGAAGSSGATTVSVRNNSSASCANETFNLTATTPAGWTAGFANAALSVAPGVTATSNLTLVVSPTQAIGAQSVTARATSATSSLQGNAALSYNVIAAQCVSAPPTIVLSPGALTASAGNSGSTIVIVRNNSSAACAVENFKLAVAVPSGWTRNFVRGTLSIAAGQQNQTKLVLGVPGGQTSGTFNLTTTATSNETGKAAGAGLSVTVDPSACEPVAPGVAIAPSTLAAAAGGDASAIVSVVNLNGAGCASETYQLEAAVPAGWTGTVGSTELTLASGESAQTTLSLQLPTDATPGAFTAAVSAVGDAGLPGSADVGVNVTADVCVTAEPTLSLSPPSMTVDGGSTDSTYVTVRNNSSVACAAETYKLTAVMPSGWSRNFVRGSLTIEPGQEAQTRLIVGVPVDEAAGVSVIPVTTGTVTEPLTVQVP